MSERSAVATHRFPRIAAGEDAAAAGYAAGYAAGMRAAAVRDAQRESDARHRLDDALAEQRARVDAAVHALRRATHELERRAAEGWTASDALVVAAAVELTGLVLSAPDVDASTLAAAAAHRVLTHPDASTLTSVRLHPADLALLNELASHHPRVSFIADPELAPGDAVGEIPDAIIDARLHSAIERCRTLAAESSP